MASGEPDASWPPLFRRHVGRWAGTATHLSPTGGLLDTHATELRQGIRGLAFAQRNTYRWAAEDGGEGAREEVHDFPGQWDATTGTLHIESARLKVSQGGAGLHCLVMRVVFSSPALGVRRGTARVSALVGGGRRAAGGGRCAFLTLGPHRQN